MQHLASKQLHHEATRCMNVPSTPLLPLPLPLPPLTAPALLLHIMYMLLARVSLQAVLGLAAVMPIYRCCWNGAWGLMRSLAAEVRVTETRGC